MFKNFNMLDGIALCSNNQDYQRTYLDQIKIDDNFQPAFFQDKPTHINKLFEHEDEFLLSSLSSPSNKKKDVRFQRTQFIVNKRKRQRINSSTSFTEKESRFYHKFDTLKKVVKNLQDVSFSKFKEIMDNKHTLTTKIEKALS